jgi:four helix bundle protein
MIALVPGCRVPGSRFGSGFRVRFRVQGSWFGMSDTPSFQKEQSCLRSQIAILATSSDSRTAVPKLLAAARVLQMPSHVASAKRLEELEVWQLGTELRDLVVASIERYGARMDRDFKDDLLRSARSIPANAAEGFGHFEPAPFAKYLRIARASAMETKNHLLECRPFFPADDVARMLELTRRTLAALAGLIRYLESSDRHRKNTKRRSRAPGSEPRTRNP